MLFSAESVLVVAQSSSEIPERLMNNPVYFGCSSHPLSGVHKSVTAASGTDHSNVGGRLLFRYYDLYHRLQLQFFILLKMGAMDTRNT